MPSSDVPYVGPSPFRREDQGRFFGRGREIREVVSLVVAHPVVLVYAASGSGKTSLLNAGVIPALEERRRFDVLPTARVSGAPEDAPGSNPYVAAVLAAWGSHDGGLGIADHLAGRARPRERDGLLVPRAVIIDQAEELFTQGGRPEDREALLTALTEALEQDPRLRLIIGIREDYLAELDSRASLLPGALRARLRLEGLRQRAALDAVTKPVEGTGRTFAAGVPDRLVKDLLGPEGFVEPVQLQVVCERLWNTLPADVSTITLEHLERFGDVDEALSSFYDDAIAAASDAAQIPEGRVRTWVEETFITPIGTRNTVASYGDETAGMKTPVVLELERRHLLHAEWRRRARWFELSHDRLIEPIKRSNRAVERSRLSELSARVEQRETSRDWGLVIGIDQYDEHPPLPAAAHDAVAVRDWLLAASGGRVPATQVELLTDPAQNDIWDALKRLLDRSEGNAERLYVYFAGHALRVGHGDLLIPSDHRQDDQRAISLPALMELLGPTSFEDQFIFVDGSRGPAAPATSGMPPPFQRHRQLGAAPSQQFVLAGAARPGSTASQDDSFTAFLLRALVGTGPAKRWSPRGGYEVRWSQVVAYVHKQVQARQFREAGGASVAPREYGARGVSGREIDPVLASFGEEAFPHEELRVVLNPREAAAMAVVSVRDDQSRVVESRAAGVASPLMFRLPPRVYTVIVEAPGYQPTYSKPIELYQPMEMMLALEPAFSPVGPPHEGPPQEASLTVRLSGGTGIVEVTDERGVLIAAAEGSVTLAGLLPGRYTVRQLAVGDVPAEQVVDLASGTATELDLPAP